MFRSFLFDHPQGAICRALCRYYNVFILLKLTRQSVVSIRQSAKRAVTNWTAKDILQQLLFSPLHVDRHLATYYGL